MLRHVVLALVVAALGGHTHAREPRVHYAGDGISFWYPAAWKYSFGPTSAPVLHYDVFLWLSTQPLHDPCTYTALGDGTGETQCTTASDGLGPGDVLVDFENLPFLRPLPHAGRRVSFGGHAARLLVRGGKIDAYIVRAPRALVHVSATCVAPGVRANEQRVLRMLRSIRFGFSA
jgi:hypothetical protein